MSSQIVFAANSRKREFGFEREKEGEGYDQDLAEFFGFLRFDL